VPLTPGIGPIKVSAEKLIVPRELSIVPGRKTVVPPFGKNNPSATSNAVKIPGSKVMSNRKA
jgi:hypothetical protein